MSDWLQQQVSEQRQYEESLEAWLDELEEEKRVHLDEHLTLLEEEMKNERERNLPEQQSAESGRLKRPLG
jgi:hypothetical protein